LQSRINQWIRLESLRDKASRINANGVLSDIFERPNLDTTYEPPIDDTENIIAGIWQEVLGIKQIGINDHFSELGGHSLLAIKIISGLRKAFQIDLPVRALFDTPTVAMLAENVKERILSEIENMSDEEAKRIVSNN
jgi:acyl carrier protein